MLTKEQQSEVQRLLKQGMPFRDIAKEANVGLSTVQRLSNKFELEDSDFGRLKADVEDLRDLFLEHLRNDHGYEEV